MRTKDETEKEKKLIEDIKKLDNVNRLVINLKDNKKRRKRIIKY